MRRNPENKQRISRIATALGAVLMPVVAACGGNFDRKGDVSRELQSGDHSHSSSVLDACGEAPEDSIGGQIPFISGEPIPGTFSCGPDEEFIAARRESNKTQRNVDSTPELSPPGISMEGPSDEWIQGQVVARNIVELAEPGIASRGPSHQWIQDNKK